MHLRILLLDSHRPPSKLLTQKASTGFDALIVREKYRPHYYSTTKKENCREENRFDGAIME
jgi:hypothetical protein